MASSDACKSSGEKYSAALSAQFNALAVVNSLVAGAAAGLFAIGLGYDAGEKIEQWLINILVALWTFVLLLSCIAVLVCTNFLHIVSEYPPTWEFLNKVWLSFQDWGSASSPYGLTIASASAFLLALAIHVVVVYWELIMKQRNPTAAPPAVVAPAAGAVAAIASVISAAIAAALAAPAAAAAAPAGAAAAQAAPAVQAGADAGAAPAAQAADALGPGVPLAGEPCATRKAYSGLSRPVRHMAMQGMLHLARWLHLSRWSVTPHIFCGCHVAKLLINLK